MTVQDDANRALQHPNVHREWSPWSENRVLHVATVYDNPFRWETRRRLFNDFRKHMEATPNVKLYVGEVQHGNRPFEVTSANNPCDVQLRTASQFFTKEAVQNLVIRRFDGSWEYGAAIDSDFTFTRYDWGIESIQQLQLYSFVQLFSSYADLSGRVLGSGYRPLRLNNGAAYNYITNGYKLPSGYVNGGWKKAGSDKCEDGYDYAAGMVVGLKGFRPVGATGGAWAFRRSAYKTVGGFPDFLIAGHGDWAFFFGLLGVEAPDIGMSSYTDGYRRAIYEWQKRATKLQANIGFVDQFATHHWHGSKFRRFYGSRWKILVENKFDPYCDLYPDEQGLHQLTLDKPKLRDALRSYFIERQEDDNAITASAGEKPLV